jgi:hypothetical protein
MAKKVDPQKIITIIDCKSADIETIDNNILMGMVGVAMAIIVGVNQPQQVVCCYGLDSYLVSVDEIERVTGEKIPVADYAKHDKPSQSWLIPRGCDKS